VNTDPRPSPPPEAWAAALSTLPGCGQHRLAGVLAAAGHQPRAAWEAVLAASLPDGALGRGADQLRARWARTAAAIDVADVWRSLTDNGVGVWVLHGEDYPRRLVDDPDPPPILFWRGDPQALDRPAVAIVGTRRCTAYGTDVARALGRDLTAAGASVVSGLALGIDGAAHEGALAARLTADLEQTDGDDDHRDGNAGDLGAPPIGVVGSGLDVVYPPRHRHLWERIAVHGLLISESPPGSAPEAWRFPRRNRILAALADVVVVVESHASGGSLSTVSAATDRGVHVMAVPGSVRSPASAGTNRLLADGVAPVTDVDDVLVALALEGVTLDARSSRARHDATTVADSDDGGDHDLLSAIDWTPTSTEDVLRRTGLDLPEASKRLTQLELAGAVRRRGAWWERVAGAR
jgi:DNA processing protein